MTIYRIGDDDGDVEVSEAVCEAFGMSDKFVKDIILAQARVIDAKPIAEFSHDAQDILLAIDFLLALQGEMHVEKGGYVQQQIKELLRKNDGGLMVKPESAYLSVVVSSIAGDLTLCREDENVALYVHDDDERLSKIMLTEELVKLLPELAKQWAAQKLRVENEG